MRKVNDLSREVKFEKPNGDVQTFRKLALERRDARFAVSHLERRALLEGIIFLVTGLGIDLGDDICVWLE
jgi:hypothetical protein